MVKFCHQFPLHLCFQEQKTDLIDLAWNSLYCTNFYVTCTKTRVGNSLLGFSWLALFKVRNALVALFKWATGANVIFYKEQESNEELFALFWPKRGKAWCKDQIWSESLVKRDNHSFIKSEWLPSLFTFLLIFTKRATRAIHSCCSFCTERPEQNTHVSLLGKNRVAHFVKSDHSESLTSLF